MFLVAMILTLSLFGKGAAYAEITELIKDPKNPYLVFMTSQQIKESGLSKTVMNRYAQKFASDYCHQQDHLELVDFRLDKTGGKMEKAVFISRHFAEREMQAYLTSGKSKFVYGYKKLSCQRTDCLIGHDNLIIATDAEMKKRQLSEEDVQRLAFDMAVEYCQSHCSGVDEDPEIEIHKTVAAPGAVDMKLLLSTSGSHQSNEFHFPIESKKLRSPSHLYYASILCFRPDPLFNPDQSCHRQGGTSISDLDNLQGFFQNMQQEMELASLTEENIQALVNGLVSYIYHVNDQARGKGRMVPYDRPYAIKGGLSAYLMDLKNRNKVVRVSDILTMIFSRDREMMKALFGKVPGQLPLPYLSDPSEALPLIALKESIPSTGKMAKVRKLETENGTFFFKKKENKEMNGSLISSEIAVSKLNKLLGFDVVEDAWKGQYMGEEGVVIKSVSPIFQQGMSRPNYYAALDGRISKESLAMLRIVDYVGNVVDRNLENFFHDSTEDKLKGIDHEGAFAMGIPAKAPGYYFSGGFFPDQYPETVKKKILDLTFDEFKDTLKDNLTESAIESAWMRMNIIKEDIKNSSLDPH